MAGAALLLALVVRTLGHGLAGEDVRELLDVRAADDRLALLALAAEPVDELGSEDVDLAVQDAALVRDLLLLLRQLVDEALELLVRERPEVGKGVHGRPWLGPGTGEYSLKPSLKVGGAGPPRLARTSRSP